MGCIRPRGDKILAKQIEPTRVSDGGIELLGTDKAYTRMEVVAKGPESYGEFEVGDILWVFGYRSGIKMDENLYLVDPEICVAVEKGESK